MCDLEVLSHHDAALIGCHGWRRSEAHCSYHNHLTHFYTADIGALVRSLIFRYGEEMSESKNPELSLADVHRWMADRERLEGEIRLIDQRLEAVRLLFPALNIDARATAEFTKQQASKIEITSRTLWTDFVTYVLADAPGGRSQKWMIRQGKETPLADRLDRSPNGLYNAVARMMGRGQLVRREDKFYLPALWNAIASGAVTDEPEDDDEPVAISAAILSLMSDGKPRVAGVIIDHIASIPDISASVERNKNYAYTVLGRMVKQKKLDKVGSAYCLPGSEAAGDVGESTSDQGLFNSLSHLSSAKAH